MIGAAHEPGPAAPAVPTARRAAQLARRSQPAWGAAPIGRRLAVVRRARRLLALRGSELAATVDHPRRQSTAETLSAEILPLADACRFLERHAARLLAPRRLAGRGPIWLGGSRLTERREPLGVVLVIGPANYPLFLPGAQTLQALAAGNAVLLKPGAGAGRPARALGRLLADAGLPAGVLTVLGEATEEARAAIAAGVDKVVLTGSAATGRAVLAALAPGLTPAVMELSGCDAVFVRADADLELTASALAFALRLNGGATCMAPRRVFVETAIAGDLERRLAERVAGLGAVPLSEEEVRSVDAVVRDALAGGARVTAGEPPRDGLMRPLVLAGVAPGAALLESDLMAPVLGLIEVADDEEALAAAAGCPYALAASIFSRRGSAGLAERVDAGVVVINDLIAPTADPRLAFGGRKRSGFGVTRGAAGLLELTSRKTVVSGRGGWRPHLRPPATGDESALLALLTLLHAGPRHWARALRRLARASRAGDPPSPPRSDSAAERRTVEEGPTR